MAFQSCTMAASEPREGVKLTSIRAGFHGGNDPDNREPFWPTAYNTSLVSPAFTRAFTRPLIGSHNTNYSAV